MNWRGVGIWITGLAAAATAGGGVGYAIYHDGSIPGIFCGLMAFTCLRLWLTSPAPLKRDLPIFDLSRSEES